MLGLFAVLSLLVLVNIARTPSNLQRLGERLGVAPALALPFRGRRIYFAANM